jgi:ArsR family transcriptional regulator
LRILRILEANDLRVQELVQVLGVAQPTVSRHLATLLRAHLVRRRREGAWTFYSLERNGGGLPASGLGQALRDHLRETRPSPEELGRLERCLAARVERSREFYTGVASRWDSVRAGIEIADMHLHLLAGVLPRALDVVDAGTGTGAMLPVLASAARRLVGVDHSAEMLEEAARRVSVSRLQRTSLVRGDIAALPLADASADAICSALALHHAARPAAVVGEFARVARARGVVVVSDLVEHSEEWMRTELAHEWLGFPVDGVVRWFEEASLTHIEARHLQRQRQARSKAMPDVFVVRGCKPLDARN